MNQQYEDYLRHILAHGTQKTDRTGTGTISVFGYQMRFNLTEGFPLIATKKVPLRLIAEELFWFLRGETNVRSLQAKGVTIWDEWRQPYSLDREVVLVAPRIREYQMYDGGFGWSVLDLSVGSVEYKLAETWRRMMRRCYDPAHERFAFYGAKGASVCRQWHDPSVFIRDAQKLPHWFYKSKDWSRFHLDKDYFGANQYGPDTSVWLREDENPMYTSAATPMRVVDIDGKAVTYLSAAEAARATSLSTSTMSRFSGGGPLSGLKGANRRFIGWVFEPIESDRLMRLALIEDGEMGPIYGANWRSWSTPRGESIDQLQKVIDTIRKNRDSRRMIVSAWNPSEVESMALPPCHCLFQFYVADGRLSCQLYQRSCDSFLGVPFNIASYALLTHLIAQQCDLAVGDFIWTGGDCHIYSNHLEQVGLQLTRDVRPLPQLSISRRPESIDGYTFADLKLTGYDHHPAIKAPVAV